MAGMLPGVECARRRRFHGSVPSGEHPTPASVAAAAGHGWTRRPSFCLYTTNNESHQASVSFSQRNVRSKAYGDVNDEKLEGVAQEAKERLDERLRNTRRRQNAKDNKVKNQKGKSHGELPTKTGSKEKLGPVFLLTEVVGPKKSRGRLINWLGWRAGDQQDCAICLDQFKTGETLMNLPCAHKFHSICLLPWLDTNLYCPYCRMKILN